MGLDADRIRIVERLYLLHRDIDILEKDLNVSEDDPFYSAYPDIVSISSCRYYLSKIETLIEDINAFKDEQ